MSVFYTGNTGGSTGPHLDLRVYNPATGSYENPSNYTSYLTNADGSAFNFQVTSGFQPEGRVHPVSGEFKPHKGIDYATPAGTALNIDGELLSTWEDSGGGGIMSQYLINTDDGARELLLLHGSKDNPITGSGALTDYQAGPGPASANNKPKVEAKERAKNYSEMSKAEMNAAYDKIRNSPNAVEEGLKMHRAFFKKP